MASSVLTCNGLRKRYGERVVVQDVSFHIEEGETYGLLGPNGAGKTTTISMLCGLLKRDAGDVVIDGISLDEHALRAKSRMGYVPQELALYPDLTAFENLRFFGQLQGLGGSELRARIDEILEVIGLADRAKDLAQTYSGGMQRRLNIGIGLLNRPRLLILDEPTVGVDPQSRNAILANVEQLSGEGMAVLYTTHYMEEAERLCDRVGIIDEGELRAEGTRRELVSLVGERDKVELSVTGDLAAAADAATRLPHVLSASTADGGIELIVEEARTLLPELIGAVAGGGAAIRSVEVVEPDLESVFLHLTGKALRN